MAAYALQRPRVFGKRVDGTLAWEPCVLLLPYLLLTWLRRRVAVMELPPDVTLLVDLTSEFGEPRALWIDREYLCLPTLDNAAPDPEAFGEVVRKVAAWDGAVYVHCALGHGRSALVAAAVLMARGLADSPKEAFAWVKLARPGVSLNSSQWAFLKKWT